MNFKLTAEQIETADRFRAYLDQLPKNIDNKVTDAVYSKLLYIRYQYTAIVLDALVQGQTLSFQALKEVVYSQVPKEFLDSIPEQMILPILQKMYLVGYIDIKETKKNYLEFTITDLGLSAVRNMTVHSMAATTFFGHQTLRLTKIGIIIAVASILIAILSAIFAYKALAP